MSVDHSTMKLGRKAIKRDSRTLRLASYLAAPGSALPQPPPSVDWTAKVSAWGMHLNDRLGCCTIAAAANAVETWSANNGGEQPVDDATVLSYYERWDGYNPADPSTDCGGIELDVLTQWRAGGFANHSLIGFASIAPGGPGGILLAKTAIDLFGGIYIGLSLPLVAQSQDVWDAPASLVLAGNAQAGSWGGHAVWVPQYDDEGFTCITWGAKKKMTREFWWAYCDEAYALLSPDWIEANVEPGRFPIDQLRADLAQIR